MQRANRGEPSFTPLEAWTSRPLAPVVRRAEPWEAHFASETEGDFLWRMTEECLDDMGSAWNACKPRGSDSWKSSLHAESRLFAELDAVLSFGPELEARIASALADIETPQQFFAVTLTAASIRSETATRLVEDIWGLGLEQDDEVLGAMTEALWRSSHPNIVELARARLAHPDPRIRASAVTILDARGEGWQDDVVALLHDTAPVVLTAVARSLRHPAVRAHQFITFGDLCRHEDEAVAAAAIRTAVCKRIGAGREAALEQCQNGRYSRADAALLLALSGNERDVTAFASWLRADAPPELFQAIGYFGAIDLVPELIGALSVAKDEARPHVAMALWRITAADLLEKVRVPLYEEADKPFVDNPDATKEISRVAEDGDAWARWWSEHRTRFLGGLRYRGGEAYEPRVAYESLDRGPHDVRSLADIELRTMAGDQAPHLFLTDWISRQRAPMAAWKAWAESATNPPRGWLHA